MRGAGDGPGWEGCWGSEGCVGVGTGVWAGPEKGRGLERSVGAGPGLEVPYTGAGTETEPTSGAGPGLRAA